MEASFLYLREQFGDTALLLLTVLLTLLLLTASFSLLKVREKWIQFWGNFDVSLIYLDSKLYDLQLWLQGNRRFKVKCALCDKQMEFFTDKKLPKDAKISCLQCEALIYKAPCDLCGVPNKFYHPNGRDNDLLNICTACSSNREEYQTHWFPQKPATGESQNNLN